MTTFDQIPRELQERAQWVCWNAQKMPINPRTGRAASVSDPATWASYGEAVRASEQFSGIGFVLTKNDPYTFIDLDYCNGDTEAATLQRQIFEHVTSYAEHSPSGKGLHIIVKADCPYGRRRHHIEVYDTARYMTMTGRVCKSAPIEPHQRAIDSILRKLGGPLNTAALVDVPQTDTDDVLWARMFAARNGTAIRELFDGTWNINYGSQSEADMALISHITFYTKNKEQIMRMFRESALGKRVKALRDDYVIGMIKRATVQTLTSLVDAAAGPRLYVQQLKDRLVDGATSLLPKTHAPVPPLQAQFPAGLVGYIAQYLYNSYSRPVAEIAIAGALSFMAGVCGRAYNVSNTGLNLYTLLLAETGTGKDAVAQGIGRIRTELAKELPGSVNFVGPKMASGQALGRHLAERSPSFVSIFGEFGKDLGRYTAASASGAERSLVAMFLDLYSKSGHGVLLPGTAYADTTKNTKDITSPAFSFFADATPESYYGVADEAAIAEGLLPRFLVIEYSGPRVARREVPIENTRLDVGVKQQLLDLCDCSLRLMAENACVDVAYDDDALAYLNAFDAAADVRINATHKTATRQLWNRAHLKALKIAALLAVGCNPHVPTITLSQAEWACALVEADVLRVIKRFEAGALGHDSDTAVQFDKRVRIVKKCLRDFPSYDLSDTANMNIKPGMQDAGIVPHSTLRRHAVAYPAFRRSGHKTPGQLFDEIVRHLIEDEVICKADLTYLRTTFGHRGAAYQILHS